MQKEEIKYSYETLWKFIIRPPRDEYEEELISNIKGKIMI